MIERIFRKIGVLSSPTEVTAEYVDTVCTKPEVQDSGGSLFYNAVNISKLKNSKELIILEDYKSKQQETEYTSGPCAVYAALEYKGYLRPEDTEIKIANEMGTHFGLDNSPKSDRGTTPVQIMEFLDRRGIKYHSHITEVFSLEPRPFARYIKDVIAKGHVMIINWNEYDGGYAALIGMTLNELNNGGDSRENILIFADTYSPYDQPQQGYSIMNFEQFVCSWVDRNVDDTPRVRQYITIE